MSEESVDATASRTGPVGRLAPSPTGLLHIGHARSFLLAWWSVRARDGRIVLRLEDLDAGRVKPGMADGCLRDLEWLGLDWDGPVIVQSNRAAEHEAALARLVEEGRAYPCVCTRKEIEEARSAPHAGDVGSRYPGTCRGRFSSLEEAEAKTGRSPALRFQLPNDLGPVPFEDAFTGRHSADVASDVGDFPVARKTGEAAYQLAVVVDDALDGVTEVLRGDDLLPSTAQQLLLQEALDLPSPTWIHVPLVVDEGSRRLAKRSDALSLAALREQGIDPRALTTWIARSAGMAPEGPAEPADLVPSFALAAIPPSPAVFGPTQRAALAAT
jgi:glutamyl-tRNA synthetase